MSSKKETYFENEISLSRSIRFWLLLVFEIPSMGCSLFILYHLIIDPNARSALKNHVIIILNIFGFIFLAVDIPLYLHFIQLGEVWPSTPAHCLIWWFVDLGFFQTCSLLMSWASVERYILIFHHRWLSTTKKRLFGHYFPLIGIVIYAMTYYIWVIFFPPCEHIFNYDLPVCGAAPCHLADQILGLWEAAIHGFSMTMIIILFSIGLLVRILMFKKTIRQPLEWRKYRKMTIQILSISSAFIIFNLPISIMFIAYRVGLPSNVGVELQLYFFFITYWLLFLLPFVSLSSLPHLREKVKRIFGMFFKNHVRVAVLASVQQ